MRILLALLILGVFLVGIIALQILLSSQKNKWLGLGIPAILLGLSIIMVLGLVGMVTTPAVMTTFDSEGMVVAETVVEMSRVDWIQITFSSIYMLLLFNIPNAILLLVYKACRDRRKEKEELLEAS